MATNFDIVDDDVYVNTCVVAEVEDRIKHIALILFEEYTRAGLELRLHPVKTTAAVILWHGEGKVDAAFTVAALVEHFGGIPFQAYGNDLIMPVADKHKYVARFPKRTAESALIFQPKLEPFARQNNHLNFLCSAMWISRETCV